MKSFFAVNMQIENMHFICRHFSVNVLMVKLVLRVEDMVPVVKRVTSENKVIFFLILITLKIS